MGKGAILHLVNRRVTFPRRWFSKVDVLTKNKPQSLLDTDFKFLKIFLNPQAEAVPPASDEAAPGLGSGVWEGIGQVRHREAR